MSKDAKNVPALRFKGYSDAWEKRKLGSLGKIKSGNGFPPREQGGHEGIPFYKVSDMNTFRNEEKMVTSQNYVTDFQVKRRKWTPISEVPAIIFAKVGAAIFLDRKRLVEQTFLMDNNMMAYILGESWNSKFCQSLFQTITLSKFAQTGALPSYNASDIAGITIFVPTNSEQKEIGLLIFKVTELIAATQHNIDALEQAKKALLQRLFDQSWRFKGYSDPWEKRKLGEVATITMGQSPDSKNYTLNPQDHILVQGNADIKNGWVEPRVWTTQITKIAKKGSVLLSVRAPVGEVSKTAFDVVLGRGVASVGQTDFLYQYLITLKINGFWLRYSTGSTFDSINSADIKDAIIFLPEKNEQSRIAKTLNCIDNLIAATQSRLSSLELLKKALLQDLFI
ncbi:restriction endonuclease subunit S [Lacticaseibacillus paracasei]|uniref:restriction endonuclease subunit S n=1 Tax=Lacticaseibacillus paracasei TaxID=1597 RepID=UPI000FF0AEB2|nr:restriction endonuclease subunit S [Lacticaseibacillus paracasei]RNE43458.1 Type I restriction modification DNA specificity domain protein [Lacticaseibacillus paracasei]